jgi:hypothetical protein
MSKKQEKNKWGMRGKDLLKFGFMQMVFTVRVSRVWIAFALTNNNHVSSSCQSHVNGSGSNLNNDSKGRRCSTSHKRKLLEQIASQFQHGIIL